MTLFSTLFSIILAATGIWAYVKVASLISLGMSLTFALLTLFFNLKGFSKCLMATYFALTAIFLVRFLKSGKFIVPGLFCLIALALGLGIIFERYKKSACQESENQRNLK